MKTQWKLILNPFEKIAGYSALIWGIAGIILASVLGYYSGFHMNGLLQFGFAPQNNFYIHILEHLTIWLVPALLFYIIGLIFSKSHVRVVDLLGTVAFAQLPFVLVCLLFFTKPLQLMRQSTLAEIINMSRSFTFIILLLITVALIVWILVWMFQAFKVSCNLKGSKLGISYVIAILAGDILCRIIIASLRNTMLIASFTPSTTDIPVTYVQDQYIDIAQQFTDNYNEERFQEAYILFSSEMQQALTSERTIQILSDTKKKAGKIISWQYLMSNQEHTTYKVKLERPIFNLTVSIDTMSHISGLYIVPYSE